MDSVNSRYIKKLCEMKEDDFTKEIIKPLFESMGFEKVEFNGGPYERGRDLIAQRRMPPKREMYLVYVQSKKIGNSQNVNDSAKISSLIHQLRQCCKKGVTDHEGKTVYPDDVYLACPENLSNRFMEELEEQFFNDPKRILPYDGAKIIADIKEFNPSLLEKLVDIEGSLVGRPDFNLVNSELVSALKSNNESGLKDFYSDLSFFVGTFDSNLLFHLDINFQRQKINFCESDWPRVKEEVYEVQKAHELSLFTEDLKTVEDRFEKEKEAYESEENLKRIADCKSIQASCNEYDILINKSLDLLSATLTRLTLSPKTVLEGDEACVKEVYSTMRGLVADYSDERVPDIHFDKESKYSKFYEESQHLSLLLTSRERLKENLGNIENKVVSEPFYTASINSDAITRKIEWYREKYFSSVDDVNSGRLGAVELKGFLKETEKALSFINKLRDEQFFLSQLVRFDGDRKHQDRVSISPKEIFSTGHDIAVYGGAGVGKTTTLYAYVDMQYENGADNLIIVPLNKIVDRYREIQREAKGKDFFKDNLLEKLVLMSKGVFPSAEHLEEASRILARDLTLVLDGLDEVYSSIPAIIPAISSFKKKNPRSQLIISSRDCVSYLNDIEFLGITLLPFTEDQLKKFVVGWLKDPKKSSKLVESIESRGLYEYIKTPLLATITCSLVERGISIPATEYEIYAERLRLLTGEYDTHKRIERQKNKGEVLRRCAIKIGFYFHQQGVRGLGESKIINFLSMSLGENYEERLLVSSFEELVDPCGVMAYEPLTNTYTFGHFRFQEYLASEELKLNRG